MTGFRNPIVAGINLIREAIRSPNYVQGVSGWTINKDGTAEFQDLTARGEIVGEGIATDVFPNRRILISSDPTWVGPDARTTVFFLRDGDPDTDAVPDGVASSIISQAPADPDLRELTINSGSLHSAYTNYQGHETDPTQATVEIGASGDINLIAARDVAADVFVQLGLLGAVNRVATGGSFQLVQANASAPLTLATGFNDVVGASVTFTTVNPNALILILGNGAFTITTGTATGIAIIQALVDGAILGSNGLFPAAAVGRGTTTTIEVDTIAAPGSHTVKLQARKNLAGAVGTADATNTKVVVLVLDMFS